MRLALVELKLPPPSCHCHGRHSKPSRHCSTIWTRHDHFTNISKVVAVCTFNDLAIWIYKYVSTEPISTWLVSWELQYYKVGRRKTMSTFKISLAGCRNLIFFWKLFESVSLVTNVQSKMSFIRYTSNTFDISFNR